MQDFSFLLGNDFRLPQIDVYGPYKQALTLRQLADAREYQRAQLRHMQLQEQDAVRKREAQERVRAALQTLPADADALTMLRHVGPEGLPLIKELEDARTAALTREQTQAGVQTKKLEQRQKIAQSVADIASSAVQIEDPLERAKFHAAGIASLIDQGILKPEEFSKYRVPGSQREAEMAYGSAYGVEALQKMRAEREKNARDEALFGPQYAKAVAEKTASQQKITGTEPIQPAQRAQLDKDPAAVQEFNQVFKPGWLQQRQLSDSPVNSYRAWLDYQQAKTPQLYTSEEEAQRVRMAKATQEGKPATTAENEAYGFYRRATNAESTLSGMEEHLKNMGLFGQGWYNLAPNLLQSDENQVIRQAQREFTEARLRKESGAAIPPYEYENDAKTYFPQPGDSEAVRLRKKQARTVIIETLRKQAGRALAGEPEGPSAPSGDKSAVPKVGDTFQGSRVKSVTRVK